MIKIHPNDKSYWKGLLFILGDKKSKVEEDSYICNNSVVNDDYEGIIKHFQD